MIRLSETETSASRPHYTSAQLHALRRLGRLLLDTQTTACATTAKSSTAQTSTALEGSRAHRKQTLLASYCERRPCGSSGLQSRSSVETLQRSTSSHQECQRGRMGFSWGEDSIGNLIAN
jgi:hypothetical protein